MNFTLMIFAAGFICGVLPVSISIWFKLHKAKKEKEIHQAQLDEIKNLKEEVKNLKKQ